MCPRPKVVALIVPAGEVGGRGEPLEIFGTERRLPVRRGELGVRGSPSLRGGAAWRSAGNALAFVSGALPPRRLAPPVRKDLPLSGQRVRGSALTRKRSLVQSTIAHQLFSLLVRESGLARSRMRCVCYARCTKGRMATFIASGGSLGLLSSPNPAGSGLVCTFWGAVECDGRIGCVPPHEVDHLLE